MTVEHSAPPKVVLLAIRFARIGEFKDEYEDFFNLAYQDKCQREGEVAAQKWAYGFAAKTMFFAVIEWSKLIIVIYLKVSGK